jgi:hypothetical protein
MCTERLMADSVTNADSWCVSIRLEYCTYEVWPDSRSVRTVFPDGLSCGGMRDEKDPQNIREAHEGQGYTGADAVWKSLVDHELLHSLVAEVVFDRPSVVLRAEAGDAAFVPAWEKHEEEAVVLAFQYWFNCDSSTRPLDGLEDSILIDLVEARWYTIHEEVTLYGESHG